ncbi:MAG: DUF1294 domain-containing protein [Thermoguttaceae bacterium]|nr:DUF1294 domain-containing protein [Thermoguttaceae bacterium]MDO4857816.1 DUF1294 domain-containing protein [Thermoguttaceae bacterium]
MDIQWKAVLIYLFAINLAAFLAMGLDKWKAQKNAWRIPEKTLFLLVILGGSVGGILGMNLFRHKTRHWYFKWGFPAIFIAQIFLVLCWYFGLLPIPTDLLNHD